MADADESDTTQYAVVINDEEQYSIWPANWPNPSGWRHSGKEGTKADCLQHIAAVWTDMRPRSLRERMVAAAHKG